MYNKKRYQFFLEAPFEIADHCCSISNNRNGKGIAIK